MWETAVKKHEEKIYQSGMLFDKQQILADQLAIKFGQLDSVDKKIRLCKSTPKLDAALRAILSAKTREEVLKCLD